MSYKKLLSLLAVSSLALAACGADEGPAEDPATEENGTEETTGTEEGTEEADGSGADEETSSQDLIEEASEEADGSAFPEYGIEIASGTWSEDGYVVPVEGEEATVEAVVVSEEEDYVVYVTEEDGTVVQVTENEPEVEFVTEAPESEETYHIGISPEEVGAEGDTIDIEEDLERYETVIVDPDAEPGEEAEE